MASDDYTVVGGGGALKLKGSKVHKKKKKRDKKTDLEKNLDTGKREGPIPDKEAKDEPRDQEDDDRPQVQKTEAEKRHDEIKKKRLLQLAESSGARPELLKTHKERVEELNTYLSRLSEHHDMPRIGPG
ncbi:hypothetical protein N0V84_002009 [Fusarium piperis]|uniref:DUF1754-domain-containing protein n=1 Tax=Fusarium piperis TaxID=1435070 RepID=A0A9W9BTU4_9HYPO|nr:hypothetical protein N0V84_002009 [Fusarium piperis]